MAGGGAWVTFSLTSGVMVLANTVAIKDDTLGAAMHAILRIVPMLVWHLVIHGRPAEDVPGDTTEDVTTAGATGDIEGR